LGDLLPVPFFVLVKTALVHAYSWWAKLLISNLI
jgi:hypothetical protein